MTGGDRRAGAGGSAPDHPDGIAPAGPHPLRVGLSGREAARRLTAYGRNELIRRAGRRWPREVVRQLAQPLAVLLAVAAALSAATGSVLLAVAILVVILLNAAFAIVEELQAERSVEALSSYLPTHAVVLRDGRHTVIEAGELVPGDLLVLAEGDRVCADARMLDGAVQVDMSALTGEASPVTRTAGDHVADAPVLEQADLLFSGTSCTAGQATALVTCTGMHTELGRIAALSERVEQERSPLELQVTRIAWLIAGCATVAGVVFLPAGLLAGLGWAAAAGFAIGLIVANVPEGLLPTITLALAIGVRDLARRNAVVKRLSAVETLGSTTVICTDKTGTLTRNDMRVARVWLGGTDVDVEATAATTPELTRLALAGALCTTAERADDTGGTALGDPTELALLRFAEDMGATVRPAERDGARVVTHAFRPALQRMTTVDRGPGVDTVHVKGAPESVLPLCETVRCPEGTRPLDEHARRQLGDVVESFAAGGLRVLAIASRDRSTGPTRASAKPSTRTSNWPDWSPWSTRRARRSPPRSSRRTPPGCAFTS